jgi:hypothetical protein
VTGVTGVPGANGLHCVVQGSPRGVDLLTLRETMSSWGCPHELNGVCLRVNQFPCDPGMKGCVLYGRFVFSNPAKNRPVKPEARSKAEEKGDSANSSR